jgi:hypothetical protein
MCNGGKTALPLARPLTLGLDTSVSFEGKSGSIAFTSPEGNSSNTINVTSPLQSGIVSNTGKQQFIIIDPLSISSVICRPEAVVGSLILSMAAILDDLNWQDIKGLQVKI